MTNQQRTAADLPAGTRVTSSEGRRGTVNGLDIGRVTNTDHPNHGRKYVGVTWDAVEGDMGLNRRSRPFVDELTIVALPLSPRADERVTYKRITDGLSPRMRNALHTLATNPQGAIPRRNLGRGGGTYGALHRRGLIGEGVDRRGEAGFFLTPLGWALLRHLDGTIRPADHDRLDVDDALAEAYPTEQCVVDELHQQPTAPAVESATVPGALVDPWTWIRRPLSSDAAQAAEERAERRQQLADSRGANAYPLAVVAVRQVVREMPWAGALRIRVTEGSPEATLTRDDLHALVYSGHTTADAVARVREAVATHIRYGEHEVHVMCPALGMRPALYLPDVMALLHHWDDQAAAVAPAAVEKQLDVLAAEVEQQHVQADADSTDKAAAVHPTRENAQLAQRT
ncbi:hypothetical protein [Streptomyces sp. URMC 124]|uniref:hypothetical protein n=1 Tax=Streptomyces sp. URMC 124 TaxID=3423405 RepID=UPI003F198C2D